MFLEHREIREVLGRPAARAARLFFTFCRGAKRRVRGRPWHGCCLNPETLTNRCYALVRMLFKLSDSEKWQVPQRQDRGISKKTDSGATVQQIAILLDFLHF